MQQRAAALFGVLPDGAEDFLRGRTWLGHPLHPLLTDIPTGAWTAAWVFDILETVGVKKLRPAGDACVALGLAAVPPTAMTGMADWYRLSGPARRLGFMHAALNGASGLAYTASLVHRLRGRRVKGHLFGHLGFALMTASAYLGGEMVYDAGANVITREVEGSPLA